MRPTCKRAAAYARVSTEKQAASRTVESQVTAIRERAGQDGQTLEPQMLFIDDGYSGDTLERPALEELRDKVAAGEVDRLYIHSPDRLSRRYAYQVLLLEEFTRSGVELVFLNHDPARSAEGELLLQMQGVIAEYERAKILERCRRGRKQRARMGDVSVFSRAPFGYRYVQKRQEGRARFEIIPEQAELVRRVYSWFVPDGLTISGICRHLNQEKQPTCTQKGLWCPSAVWGILRNPAYMGRARFGRTRMGPKRPKIRTFKGQPAQPRIRGSHYHTEPHEQIEVPVPPIVDEETFRLAQERLVENRRRSRSAADGPRHLLQGLLVCSKCGRALVYHPSVAKGGRRYDYYRCTGLDTHQWRGTRICDSRAVKAADLEQAVWGDARDLLTDPQRLSREYQRRLHDSQATVSLAAEVGGKKVERVRQGLERLIDAFQDGLLTKQEFEARSNQARERLQALQAETRIRAEAEATRKAAGDVLRGFEEFAKAVCYGADLEDFHTRVKILRLLIKKIDVDDQEVRIAYKVSELPFDRAPGRGLLQDCSKRQTVALPPEDLEPVGRPIAEDEQPARQRILAEALAHQCGQCVERFAHVGRPSANVDPHRGGKAQHGRPSKTATKSPSAARSSRPSRRRTCPPQSTTSTATCGAAGSDVDDSTTNGTNAGGLPTAFNASSRRQ
jgi:site-specific DNA recombinase